MSQATGVIAPPSKPAWYRRHWLQLLAAGLIGIGIGGASAGSPATKTVTKTETVTDTSTVSDLRSQLATVSAERDQAKADAAGAGAKAKAAVDASYKKRVAAVAAQEAALARRQKAVGIAEKSYASNSFGGDGTYLVGKDVKVGTYRAAASPGCYWARLRDLNGTVNSIADNTNTDGPTVIQVHSSDKAIEVAGCSTFHKIA